MKIPWKLQVGLLYVNPSAPTRLAYTNLPTQMPTHAYCTPHRESPTQPYWSSIFIGIPLFQKKNSSNGMRSACDSHRSKRTWRSSQSGVILRWNWEASKSNFADLGVYAPLSNKPTFVRSYQKGLGLTKTSPGWKKTTGRSYCWWWELQDVFEEFARQAPPHNHLNMRSTSVLVVLPSGFL